MIKFLPLAAIHGFFGTLFLAFLGLRYWTTTHETKTEQPISNFSHKVHVGQANLACSQCHTYFDQSRRPGIPTVKMCVDCHKDGEKPGQVLVKKEYWEKNRPIEWNRIHTLPDHVYFSHKRHVKALSEKWHLTLTKPDGMGNTEDQARLCATCHGEVKYMDQIRQVRSLSMGWCVSCHRQNGASIDCWTCHK